MTAQPPSDTDESRKTTCYRCACRCGVDVHLRAGKLRTIEGNRDHPVNRGVICAKGAAGIQQVTAPARLRAPLKRVGPRGARIVSVNPTRTGCNAVADDWLGLTPGTDGLLILALVHELLVAGRIDLDDLARFTDALAPFDGDGVEPDLRGPWPGHRHDRMIGRPVGFHAMRGIAAHANGFQTARALHLLQMLLGAIETPGACASNRPIRSRSPPIRCSVLLPNRESRLTCRACRPASGGAFAGGRGFRRAAEARGAEGAKETFCPNARRDRR